MDFILGGSHPSIIFTKPLVKIYWVYERSAARMYQRDGTEVQLQAPAGFPRFRGDGLAHARALESP